MYYVTCLSAYSSSLSSSSSNIQQKSTHNPCLISIVIHCHVNERHLSITHVFLDYLYTYRFAIEYKLFWIFVHIRLCLFFRLFCIKKLYRKIFLLLITSFSPRSFAARSVAKGFVKILVHIPYAFVECG